MLYTHVPCDLCPLGVSEGDLAWVGAWWGGIIIGAILIFVFGITLFFFPKQILFKKGVKAKEEEEAGEEEEEEEEEQEEEEEKEGTEKSLVKETQGKLADDSACFR